MVLNKIRLKLAEFCFNLNYDFCLILAKNYQHGLDKTFKLCYTTR